MQSSNHVEGQFAAAVQHLMHAVAAADKGNEIARLKPILIHVILDRFHRVRQIERVMLLFESLDQRYQHVEPIAFRRVFIWQIGFTRTLC